jgi:dynein heavy chain
VAPLFLPGCLNPDKVLTTLHLSTPQVMHNFLPSAVKFHYQFNLREMSNVVGGLCRMTKDVYKEPVRVGALGGVNQPVYK